MQPTTTKRFEDVPSGLEDCAGFFEDFWSAKIAGDLEAYGYDNELADLHDTIADLAKTLATRCVEYNQRLKELKDAPKRYGDPNDEHRLSAAQLGVGGR